ncbi:MAG: hypothetical protein ACR2LU_07645 [Luteitalea sp.]
MRSTLAIVAGLVIAFGLVATIEAIGHAIYPVQAFDADDPERIRAAMASLPLGALVIVVAAWWIASFTGGAIAAALARHRPLLHAGAIGGLVLAATVANLVMLPHPAWVAIVGPLGIVVATGLAAEVVRRRQRLPDPPRA